ncbi:MAG: rRNA (uracil1939-C5)-methyltransferase [Candidatus Binatota bacterium]|jgi:23S rRNA (uracil1939-C5)-methyltransferase|nr:rRNA (uracil1939-C5)-methyltransferase [Candidatus Binatota bacterium]
MGACPHAPQCVPCPFRGLAYRAQLARKKQRVIEAVAPYSSLAPVEVEDVVGSRDLFGYRNVAKLVVRADSGGRLRAGVYAPGSHRLVDADGCEVQHPAINEVVSAALEESARLGISAYDETAREGDLRYLVARYSAWQKRVLLVVVTRARRLPALAALAKAISRRSRWLGGVVQNVNADPGNVILGREWATIRPPAEIVERIGFLKLQSAPGSFLQANVWTARRIYETVLAWSALTNDERALDLYTGVGALALHLATAAERVVGVEDAPQAARDARANARRNGFHNARFLDGESHRRAAELADAGERFAVVTVNPPRKGLDPAVVETLPHLAPRRILYVSCQPESLARDLERLATVGYTTIRVQPFDMLPQTDHVEVLAQLDRA